ncbi:MAG: nuclear transport factor 2 family protein, partial [Betaproteobacteria bacterium]|nr:nuclear transport factor 2 family protein [Betaproteobacteria bacterium]
MNTLERNKKICRDYFTAFLNRDADWMNHHIAPDFVRHDPGLPFQVKGPEGVLQLHDALLPAFPDMSLPLEAWGFAASKAGRHSEMPGNQ